MILGIFIVYSHVKIATCNFMFACNLTYFQLYLFFIYIYLLMWNTTWTTFCFDTLFIFIKTM